jgi:hypothetical protein
MMFNHTWSEKQEEELFYAWQSLEHTPSSPWCNGPDFGMAVFVA